MANFLSLLLTFSFFYGQLGRIQIGNFSLTYLDLALPILFVSNFIFHFHRGKPVFKNRPFQIFLIIAWLVYIYHSFSSFHLISLAYLIRLTILLSFFILPPSFINRQIFHLGIIANIIFGLIQYFVWPDFTAFSSLNWDPHLYRLVSSYYDPTFTALIYLIFIIYLFCSIPKSHFLLLMSYLALSLTYSRSTFLSLAFVSFFLSRQLKKPLIGVYTLLLVVFTIIALPRHPGEGTKLERDSSIFAKIINYQEGVSLFKHPLAGVGYNNLPFARQVNANSHAAGGFDSSLLTILTATGLLGIVPFILGLYDFFKSSPPIAKASLVAVLIHSLFANSLLYPFVLIYLSII